MSASSGGSGMDMLQGRLVPRLLVFALPLFLSGVMQQSFNSADIVVAGRWVGHEALAAVGNNGVVISLIVNLFVGISVGANVVIAHYIGQRNDEGVRRAVSTSAVVAVVSGVALLVVAEVMAEPVLRMLRTPEEILPLSAEYLRIFALGLPFMMVFNFGSAILRSVGDTRRPFYILLVSGVVNVLLNLLFVIVFGMGVAGVATATVIAGCINALLIVRCLVREQGPCRIDFGHLKAYRHELVKVLKIGVPAGLQGVVFSISNVFILATINSFGAYAASGSSAALNFEYYSYFAISAFAQAAVAFTSQNYGAGQYGRVREVFRKSILLAVVVSAAINIVVALNAEACVGLFTTDPEVIRYATIRVEWVLAFQFIACSYEVSGGVLRGLGYSMTPTVLTILGTCVLRLGWVAWIHRTGGSFAELMMVYPVSWVITGVAVYAAYRIVGRRVLRADAA